MKTKFAVSDKTGNWPGVTSCNRSTGYLDQWESTRVTRVTNMDATVYRKIMDATINFCLMFNFSIIFEYRHRFIIWNKIFDKISSSSSTCDHKFKVGTIMEHPCCSMSLRNSKFRNLRTRTKTDVRRPQLWYEHYLLMNSNILKILPSFWCSFWTRHNIWISIFDQPK